MAVNIIGQNIQLLLNQSLGADISQGLKPGDLIQARLAELLPDNRAIIQFKGMNLLAALPPAQPGQAFSKGAVLELAVLQAKPQSTPGSPAQAGQTAHAPSLSLKLIGINLAPAQPLFQASETLASALPRQTLENLLNQAQIPVTPANLQVAQSLSRYGMPVDKATLSSVLQNAEAMLNVESLPQAAPEGSVAAPLPQPIQTVLDEAKTLLNVLTTQPDRAADKPVLQALIRQVDELLGQAPVATAPVSTAAPEIPDLPQAIPQQPQAFAAQIETTLSQISDAKPGSLKNLEAEFQAIQEALPQWSEPLSAPLPTQPLPELPAAQLPPALSQNLLREASAAVVRELLPQTQQEQGRPLDQSSLLAKIDDLSARVLDPKSSVSDEIFQSAKSQLTEPLSQPVADTRPAVLQALNQLRQAFISQPLQAPVNTETALIHAFEARDLPAPQIALTSLPKESVLEAVAFLKARGLPQTRSLVEAVATELSQGKDLGAVVQEIVSTEAQIPLTVLDQNPPLKQAFQELQQFLETSGFKPESDQAWTQLRDFVGSSGLNLENSLLKLADPAPAPTPLQLNPATTLKADLLKLKDAVQHAAQNPSAQSSPEATAKLEHLSSQISGAINTLNTLSLSSRPTPAFDVTTVQMPVFIGGQMQGGQLSIYWKRGRPHELSSQDPVNVVFLLNTRGLGEVKVQLQVWKTECQCRVTVNDGSTKNFIQESSAELKASFEKNTRFALSNLDITTADAIGSALNRSLGLLEPLEGVGTESALNLTA